jgi:hypothetical protein
MDETSTPVDTPKTVDDTYDVMVKADWFFVAGLVLTFVLGAACMVMNFVKPGSTPAEPIWGLACVVLGHKVSSDKFGT